LISRFAQRSARFCPRVSLRTDRISESRRGTRSNRSRFLYQILSVIKQTKNRPKQSPQASSARPIEGIRKTKQKRQRHAPGHGARLPPSDTASSQEIAIAWLRVGALLRSQRAGPTSGLDAPSGSASPDRSHASIPGSPALGQSPSSSDTRNTILLWHKKGKRSCLLTISAKREREKKLWN
jgi:hypothetical protein